MQGGPTWCVNGQEQPLSGRHGGPVMVLQEACPPVFSLLFASQRPPPPIFFSFLPLVTFIFLVSFIFCQNTKHWNVWLPLTALFLSLSHIWLFSDPMDCIAHQAPLSMGFSRKEYWNGSPFPSPGDLPDPGTEPVSPALAGGFFTTEPPEKPFL